MSPFALGLAALIGVRGPIGVDAFMAACNAYYYASRDPFGAAGDFTTAPEISQMFGELIGAALAQAWMDQGASALVQIVELGPGRGTLMADLRRTLAQIAPALTRCASIHLVEQSPVLRALQEARLGPDIQWHERLEDVPAQGTLLLIANEFFDCLPIRQEVMTSAGAEARCVGFTRGAFHYVTQDGKPFAEADRLAETSPARSACMGVIAQRIIKQGGAALIVDYGHLRTAPGDTLQALRAHQFVSPLDDPGEADLTAHVDFEALVNAAEGVQVHGPVTQGAFLTQLGITARANRLKQAGGEKTGADVDAAHGRLTGADQMGSLFKVMALTRIGAPEPAGFTAG